MKKFLILTLILAVSGFVGYKVAEASDLTYGQTNYVLHKGALHSAGTNDPLYNFIGEVDDTFGGSLSIDFMLFEPTTEPGTPAAGQLYFDTASNTFKFANNSATFVTLATAAGNSLDQSYDAGIAITVDAGAVALTAPNAADNVALAIAQADTGTSKGVTITNAGSGNSLDFQGTSGFDIEGTDNSWNVTVAGIFDGEGLTGVTNNQTITFGVNNVITFGDDDTEDISMNFSGGNTLLWASTSGVDTMNFGDVDVLGQIENITFDAADASIITQAGTGNADDLTIRQTGTVDVSLILSSAGSITDALSLITTDAVGVIKIASSDILDIDAVDNVNIDISGAGANFDLDTVNGSILLTAGGAANGDITLTAGDDYTVAGTNAISITNSGAAEDITIDAVAASVNIDGGEEDAAAVTIAASGTAGGMTLDYGTGNMVITGTGASADFTLDADLISIDGTGASNITFTNGADEDVTIATAGAADHSLIISATGTAADAMQLTTSAGGMDITNGGASGEDLDIDGVLSAVTINSDEATTDAIDISATAGGITIASTAVASTWTHTATGAADDLSLIVAGAADGSLVLTSSGTATNAIDINATAGGIDIDISGAAATEDFAVTTDSSITFITTEAAADQFKIDAQGAFASNVINLETSNGGILLNADGANGNIGINSAVDLTLTAAGDLALAVTGNVTGNIVGDGSDNMVGYLKAVEIEPDAAEQVLIGDSGKIFANTANEGVTTYTLPDAVAGLIYYFVDNSSTGGDDVVIDCQAGDNIDHDTNGDAIESVTDAYPQTIILVALNGTDWATMGVTGTWGQQ